MKIDWKYLAATPGYKSLKAAYIEDVKKASKQSRPMRCKDDFLSKFQWVINRAKHYAYHTGRSVESILNEWEDTRNYWWLNYYQNSHQPKFHSGSVKALGTNGLPERQKLKPKARWSSARKKRGY
jgi:hypothetical protein